MPTLTVETVRTDGVTFVEVVVEVDRPHRVRIEPRFDGPIWPPRRNGRPIDGWDEQGVTLAVDAGKAPVGFATPAEPEAVSVELIDTEPISKTPDGIAAWFRRIERRVERAEALTAVDDLESASVAIAAAGGLTEVEALAATLDRDRRALSRLSVAPDELQQRARAVSLSTKTRTFARLTAKIPTPHGDRDTCSGR